jgi:hypothetical protein
MARIRAFGYRSLALVAASGTLLASGNCLPQDYFATLAGDTISLTVAEIVARVLTATLDATTGA